MSRSNKFLNHLGNHRCRRFLTSLINHFMSFSRERFTLLQGKNDLHPIAPLCPPQTKRVAALLAGLSIVSLLLSSGCDSTKSKIIGKWYEANSEANSADTIEFFSNGKLNTTDDGINLSGSWSVIDGNKIYFEFTAFGMTRSRVYNVTFTNNKMTLSLDGESSVFVRTPNPPKDLNNSGADQPNPVDPRGSTPQFQSNSSNQSINSILKLCNRTSGQTLFAAYASKSSSNTDSQSGMWVSSGWHELAPNQCKDQALPSHYSASNSQVLVYAESTGRTSIWQGLNGVSMCVHHPNPFTYTWQDPEPACDGQGESRVKATLFDTKPGINTWNFNP